MLGHAFERAIGFKRRARNRAAVQHRGHAVAQFGEARTVKTRGFRPRMDWHTYRSYGYLVGMLLVRSLDRSQRVLAAMKCRGFRGRFYLLDHFAATRYDLGFSLAAGLILAALGLLGLG